MARGRRIFGPKGGFLRPASDLVREAVFQILTVRMEEPWASSRVLDLFSGTGALGIEALSRGAMEVIFADRDKRALELAVRNLTVCGFLSHARLIRMDVTRKNRMSGQVLRHGPYRLILADPPYSAGLGARALDWVAEHNCLCEGGWMVVEAQKGTEMPEFVPIGGEISPGASRQVAGLEKIDLRLYGQTGVWFYQYVRQKNSTE